MAYDLLADVVAEVSGQSFEQYVKETILLPLQMARSSFLLSDIDLVWRTSPHPGVPLQVASVYPYNRMHAPSSTLNSNVIDLSHWLIANLNQGVYNTTRILSEASVAKMQTATFSIAPLQVGLWVWAGLFTRIVGLRLFIMMVPTMAMCQRYI